MVTTTKVLVLTSAILCPWVMYRQKGAFYGAPHNPNCTPFKVLFHPTPTLYYNLRGRHGIVLLLVRGEGLLVKTACSFGIHIRRSTIVTTSESCSGDFY